MIKSTDVVLLSVSLFVTYFLTAKFEKQKKLNFE